MVTSIPEAVNKFYEENPFPSYDLEAYTSRRDLAREASRYARILDAHLPYDCDLADVGCGTGQLTCFLALKGRRVTGLDFARASLERAEQLRDRLGIENVTFRRADVLELELPDASFDYVLCNGVLHHTPDPRRGFGHVARICRPGGYVIVGLYNTYGRLGRRARRSVAGALSSRARAVEDGEMEGLFSGERKKEIYFADQFRHPHESTHTLSEVLRWFREEGLSYVSSLPAAELFRSAGPMEDPFTLPGGSAFWRGTPLLVAKQLGWMMRLGPAGGAFTVVGRKSA